MSAVMHNCSMCPFSTSKVSRYIHHILRVHKNSPNFLISCNLGTCAYTTKSWKAFKQHNWRCHKEVGSISDEHMAATGGEESVIGDVLDIPSDETNTLFENFAFLKNAEYALKLETQHRIPKSAVNDIIAHTSLLVSHYVTQAVNKVVTTSGIKLGSEVLESIKHVDFSNISTDHNRHKYYQTHCKLISPEEVLVGSESKTVNGETREIKKLGYYVPFKESIQALLQLPEVLRAVQTSHYSQNDMMHDICDGTFIREHTVFQQNVNALQIILNHDDMEIVNPLGTHVKKHKLSMFYYSLANIPPQFRSKLSSIQLVAIAKSRDIRKFGVKTLLQDFLNTLNDMQQKGIEIEINGSKQTVYGALVMVPCDTLAAQWLGGFKEGVAFAVKPCRTCEVTKVDLKRKFSHVECEERQFGEHSERTAALKTLSKASMEYWSKMWGIKEASALSNIKDFPLSQCLVHDPMHVLTEGIVPYEMALMLYSFVYCKNYFSLAYLNAQMENFAFSYLDSSHKPEKIDQKQLATDKKIKQTSASILTLCYALPFLIGHKVKRDDEMWKNFVRLSQITMLATSPLADLNTVGQLDQLISSHHYKFQEIFPSETITPKFHYCLHIPEQIKRFGPGRNQWCLRFEGKHGFFKQKKWHCFKNISKSMSEYHQKYMCYRMLCSNPLLEVGNENFLYAGDIVKEGTEVDIAVKFPDIKGQCISLFLEHNLEVVEPLLAYMSPAVSIKGHTYKPGVALLLSWENLVPVFGLLCHNLVYDQMKFFVVDKLSNCGYDDHYNSYVVTPTGRLRVLSYCSIVNNWPLPVHYVNNEMYVTNRYCHFVENV